MDFLKIDLEDYGQPAIARLSETIERGATFIVETEFDESGAQITRFGSVMKSKKFRMNTKEMDTLCEAWTEYKVRVAAYKAEQEAAEAATIEEAKALASSMKFDLDTLNIQVYKDEDNCWQVCIPAIRFERYSPVDELKETVQEAIDHIRTDIIRAEKYSWGKDGEWKDIIASYRKVFPLAEQCHQCHKDDLPLNQETKLCVRCLVDNEVAAKQEQEATLKVKVNLQAPTKEPDEIIEARKIIAQTPELDGWQIRPVENTAGSYILDGYDANGYLYTGTPTQILTDLKDHTNRWELKQQAPELSALPE